MADGWVYWVAPLPALIYDHFRDNKALSGFNEAMKSNFGNSAATARFLSVLPEDDQIDMALQIRDGAASEPLILGALRNVARMGTNTDDRRQNKLAVVNMMLDRAAQTSNGLKHYTDKMTDDQKVAIAQDFVSGGVDAMKNKVKLTVWDVALTEKIPDPAQREKINNSISREDRLKYVTEFETDPAKATKDIEVAVFDAVVTDANPAAVIFLKDITPERKAQLIEISDPDARKAAITKELTDKKNALIDGLKSFLPGKRADAGPDATSPKLAAVPSATPSFTLANILGISTGDQQNDKPRPAVGTAPKVP